MENIQQQENQIINEEPKIPQFLKVLCILSFIGSAFAFIGAIWGYFSAKASAAVIERMGEMEEGDALGVMGAMQDTMRKAAENAVPNLIIGVVCALLCLFGAIQMWKLKKTGFFIYTLGELAAPISMFILGGGGLIGGIGAAFGLIIATVWVVLYAVNLKHMK
jgi:hypothetical protein